MIYFISKTVGNYSGAATVARDVVESLIATDNKIGVVNRARKIPKRLSKELKKAVWIKMPYYPRKETFEGSRFATARYVIRYLKYKVEMKRMKRQLKKEPPDLMLFNALTFEEQKLYQHFRNQYKTVQIVHLSPGFLQDFDNQLSLDSAIDIFRSSDALIFVSDECRKEWLSYSDLKNKKSFYIPNCADEIKANQLLKKHKKNIRIDLGMDSDKFYLVLVASIKPAKGQDLLVKAAPALKKIAPNLEILVIGRGKGDYVKNLKKECNNNGLNFVNFLGQKTNALDYIYASDALILTSRTEAFPLVILEAMVLKTPVLASNVNGVREMISDRENGYLFESDNVNDLTAAFNSMYNNKEERDLFTRKSSQKYWNNFSKNHFTKKYEKVIKKMKK